MRSPTTSPPVIAVMLGVPRGFMAPFQGTGVGSPKFAGIPGEAFNGVFSANEFLTRVNLGAGNTAMDTLRVSKLMGAQSVTCVYRRSREELERATEEGIEFMWLTAPVEIIGDSCGWVKGMRVQKMELGEPDSSGRRRPLPIKGSEFVLGIDTVIYALGTSANPIIAQTTP